MQVSPEELSQLMLRPGARAFRLLDVRDAEDFRISHFDGAESIPLSSLATDVSLRLGPKDTPIVLYCLRGKTSEEAAEMLEEQGYEFVFQLTGGLEAWKTIVDPAFRLETGSNPAPSPAGAS